MRNGWEWKYFISRSVNYHCFNRVEYINERLERGLPLVIIWVPSFISLHCREHDDIYGIPDIVGIEEIPTMFTGVNGMERFKIFLIPYLITGYNIPPELEQDDEPLVPFTVKTIEMIKEMENKYEGKAST